jgi:CDP-diacylglycerol--glycerol-3-phosphate 3-phosphatidyltransferase
MTLPNKLTVLRMLLAFFIMALLLVPGVIAKLAALATFGLASFTDWLDGWLARRSRQTSALGALLDPIADKVLVLGTFLAFVQLRLVPAWMVLVILLRELIITGVRLVVASRQTVLAAAREGKHKMVSQLTTILLILVVLVIREASGPGGLDANVDAVLNGAVIAAMWITVILTVVSGAQFFWRHQAVLRDALGR